MGRDSQFIVLLRGGEDDDEDEAYEGLLRRLRTRGTLDDDWSGWGDVVRLRDVLRDGLATWVPVHAAYVWLGYGRNVHYPTLLREMAALPWRDREGVQVLTRDQEDEAYATWLLRGDVFVEAEHSGLERDPSGGWGYGLLRVLPLRGPEDEPGG